LPFGFEMPESNNEIVSDTHDWILATCSRAFSAVIPKLGGAQNIESGVHKNYGNAPKLNYQLMKLSVYLLTLQNP
jgi:hypothetical protein